MELNKLGAEVFIPDGAPIEEALERTTCMAISAHQDDIEIMAYDGIAKCFGKDDAWFTGVVVTDGKGSPRRGIYSSCTSEEMQEIRKKEQKKAAFVGEYAAQFLLNYSSSEVKDDQNTEIISELAQILSLTQPEVVYTHNLVDKHDTHVATVIKVIKAIRELPREIRPKKLYGCEVWRDLDWIPDDKKVVFDLSPHENIASALIGLYDSQICVGKRYDLAEMGRRKAHSAFSHVLNINNASSAGYAMDMTPLIEKDERDIKQYVMYYITVFANEVLDNIDKFN
ncbi:MAG: PIG-L deacetylase family protein [Deltaproteobacteria bacterium]